MFAIQHFLSHFLHIQTLPKKIKLLASQGLQEDPKAKDEDLRAAILLF